MKKEILHTTVQDSKPVSLLKSVRKHFIILCAMLGLSVVTKEATARGSELQLSLWNNASFMVELDGQRFKSECDFIARDLAPGTHSLRVSRKKQNNYSGHGGMITILFNGCIEIPFQSRVIAQIKPDRCLDIIRVIRLSQSSHCGNGYYGDDEYYEYEEYNHQSAHPVVQTKPLIIPHRECMTDEELSQLLCRMDDTWFDDDKLRISKQAIGGRHLLSKQVMQVMEKFWYEENRLAFAKFAYEHASDSHNYYLVNDAFWFSSSISDLDEYINGIASNN